MSKIRKIREAAGMPQAKYLAVAQGADVSGDPPKANAPAQPATLFDAVKAMVPAAPQRVSLMDQLVNRLPAGDGASAAQGALDLINNAPEPPQSTKMPIPHVITFSGIANNIGKVYRNPDEAIKASRQNARYMRNDLLVMECLEARQRATALLPWHVEPEDPKDPGQVQAAAQLTSVIERIPRFTEFRRSLLEAIWYGREATQNIYGPKTIKGEDWLTVTDWQPINGDKLAFKWNGDVGIRIGIFGLGQNDLDCEGHNCKDDIATGGRRAKVEVCGEYGRCYFLTGDERDRTIIHKHMVEDGEFEDPVAAGAIHGVGIRSRIYWTWFQKQSVLALLMEYLERSAVGFDIWTFPWGNPQAEADMRAAAEQRVSGTRNIVLVPVMPGQEGLFNYKHEEPGLEGAKLINDIVHQFFQWQIKRYILGQILSTEPEGGGLGSSGLSDLHKDSLMSVVNYDCRNLEETLTEQLLAHLVKLNRHKLPESAKNARFKFVIDSESSDIKESMEAMEKAWNMNLPIAEKELYKVTGLSAPDADDKVLKGPSGDQGQQMPGQKQPGGPKNLAEHLGSQMQDDQPKNLLEHLVSAQYAKDRARIEELTDKLHKQAMAASPIELAPVVEPPAIPERFRYSHDLVSGTFKARYSLDREIPEECPDPTGFLAHAAAHALDNGISADIGWKDAWQAELADGQVSKYATLSAREGFAEFGRLVVTDRRLAQAECPQCWGIYEQAGIVERSTAPASVVRYEATPREGNQPLNVTVNIPERFATVNNYLPAPIVNVEQKPPEVTVNVPEQKAPEVTVNVPETTVQNTVNVPQQAAPTVEVNPTINVPEQPAPIIKNEINLPAKAERKGSMCPDGKGGFEWYSEEAK